MKNCWVSDCTCTKKLRRQCNNQCTFKLEGRLVSLCIMYVWHLNSLLRPSPLSKKVNSLLRPSPLSKKVNSVQQFSINLALHRYGKLTCHMGSHSVTCHPAEVSLYPQPKQVLNLATLEGCKAELTYVTWKLNGWELNPRPVNRKSNALPPYR